MQGQFNPTDDGDDVEQEENNIITVLFLTRGEGCARLPGANKLRWFKRVHKRSGDEGKLIRSSDEVISKEKMEDVVHIALQNVEQVFSDMSESNTSTAEKFFPNISPDLIRFEDKRRFDFKLRDAVYADVVAVIVSPDQLKMITGIVDDAFFAIHAVGYKVANNQLEMLKSDVVSHGTHAYNKTSSDMSQCNVDEDVEMLKHYRRVVIGKYCNWLNLIRDDVKLYKLRILQSHDSCTGLMNFYDRSTWQFMEMKYLPSFMANALNRSETIAKWSITQSMTIAEQLNAGVRSFDLRVFAQKDGNILMHHGAIIIKVNFFDILQTLLTFLSEHPTEFLYVLLKISGDGDKDDVWQNFLNMSGDLLILPTCSDTRRLTVGEVRGKLLAWSAQPKFTGTNNDIISYYKTYAEKGCKGEVNKIARNWTEFEEMYMPCFPLGKDKNNLFVFQLHNQVDLSLIKNIVGGGGIMAASRRFNAHAMKWLKTHGNSRDLNIIEMDYIKSGFIRDFIWNLNTAYLKDDAPEIFENSPLC